MEKPSHDDMIIRTRFRSSLSDRSLAPNELSMLFDDSKIKMAKYSFENIGRNFRYSEPGKVKDVKEI